MNDRRPDIDAIDVLRCADCAASDSAAYDAVPVDYMPIPTEAFAGFPDGVPSMSRINRGRFLKNGALGFAAVYAASKIPWQTAFEAAAADAAVADNHCLVMLFLNGGNDGPNTFVPTDPTQYAEYRRLRPTIARLNGPTVAGQAGIGSVPMLGIEGQLALPDLPGLAQPGTGNSASLKTLWDAGNVALFPATDYPNPNFSHFTSRDWWFAGVLAKSQTGWLGRWLDAYGNPNNPLQAVSIGSNVSKIIRATRAPVAAVPESLGANFGFNVSGALTPTVNVEVGKLATAPPGNASTNRSRTIYGQTVQVASQLGPIAPGPATTYPANSSLSTRLRAAAAMLAAPFGTRIVTIDWGGFDTHGNQVASQDPQLQVLGQALAAFQADLATRGIADRVVTCVFSEFGRRADENASFGTDHGEGGPMQIIGTQVRGGLAAEPASMTVLNRGNLKATTDFRSVYAALLSEWMGGDAAAILPGAPLSLGRPGGLSLIL
jgi:uncharacterized protein (DUF1501 family)